MKILFTIYFDKREGIFLLFFLETDALGHINNNTYGVCFEAARDEIFHIFMPKVNIRVESYHGS